MILLQKALPITRRAALGGLGAALTLGPARLSFAAAPTNARLVILNIRGGLDGLATVIPYGDPSLAGLRSGLVPAGMLKLDNFYALHPSLPNFHAMMQAGQAMAIHAVGPTIATRSHFEGQDYLQSGTGQLLTSGWLNRAVQSAGGTVPGLALAAQVPLLLRGALPVAGWAPDPIQTQMPAALASQVQALAMPDPALGPAEQMGFASRTLYNQILGASNNTDPSCLVALARVAGTLLAASNGPRVVAMQTNSVDTHEHQNTSLPDMLSQIDGALGALKTALGPAWASTVVLTMTEFGRTAYENGTQGTDHGTGFAVLLAGGAVAGGRVLATWPGLTTAALFQGRDLAPTVDYRAIAMGVLCGHLGVSTAAQPVIFPGSAGITPLAGLTTS